ncbi:DUF1848 domain-containing protein [Mobilitalea sibirica]|uniref:DUF1848 domain-containing protein n=1 Tax=Mobilitalea sibirica TaxID=1462919 RepID=A0A8J7HAR1_9FIRM|nr:DUF1848 domain-containing protein [Mobilitalea sibirica]MBH1941585.1 DUF1848 domain-containing protein [Mobilitalea sibirica]
MILSASRRTDLPAFYSDWFMNRLKEGYVLTRNPMNPLQVSKITLSPKVIDCIVFWTKDPANIIDKLPELDAMGYQYYFQFTLTPYNKELEQNLRDKQDIIRTFLMLSEKIGKEKVLLRYDPVILNDIITIEYHRNSFEALCKQLTDYTEICTISFVDLYSKLKKAVSKHLIREITDDEKYQLARYFSDIGRDYGIEIRSCCEKLDLKEYGIKPSSCIDQKTIEKVCGYSIDAKQDNNQRTGCGCIQSIDIGVYNTCKNGCVYCYANDNASSVEKNYHSHNSYSDLLIGTVNPNVKIKTKEIKLLRNDQMKLF